MMRPPPSARQRRQRQFMALLRQLKGSAYSMPQAHLLAEWPHIQEQARLAKLHLETAIANLSANFRAEFPIPKDEP